MAESSSPRRRRRRPEVFIGPVDDRHNGGLAEFFSTAWGSESSGQEVAEWRAREAAENPAFEGDEPPKWVFVRGERVLGYLGTIPEQFVTPGGEFSAYWLKGFWVAEEFRSGPVGFEILKCAVEAIQATAVSTVAPEARRLFEAQGLEPVGVLFNRLRPLRPGRILRMIDPDRALQGIPAPVRGAMRALQVTRTAGIAGWLAGLAISARARLGGIREPGLRVTIGWDQLPDDALDQLWSDVKSELAAATVRDGRLTRWRYGAGEKYRPVAVWAGEKLRGWAVVRVPSPASEGRLQGVSVAVLSDILFSPERPAVGRAVVAAAEAEASRIGADAILCSGSHPTLEGVLGDRGFLKLPGNVHIMARSDGDRIFPSDLSAWWLTRGDAQSDGSF